MRLSIVARRSLADALPAGSSEPALLLEGDWPAGTPAATRWSLDESLDGRFAWIDQAAAELAAALGADDDRGAASPGGAGDVWPLYLVALELRYYLVKLLRPVAFFRDVRPLGPGDHLEFHGQSQRDRDYADILRQLAQAAGAGFAEHQHALPAAAEPLPPPNGRMRRWLGELLPRLPFRRPSRHSAPRVILAGNPRLLDPVCRELVARGTAVWWLYDRFAVGAWRQWHRWGVGQLVCNASLGTDDRLEASLPAAIDFHGIDLAAALRRWWHARRRHHGPRLTRLLQSIDRHLVRVEPDALLVDEDATPLARAAVALARRRGVRSAVLQHGAPYCRFGFAPLAADRALVWGPAAWRQFRRWGVPPERLTITGSPWHDELAAAWPRIASAAPPAAPTEDRAPPRRVLLVLTAPPRDERPDAVALHLTSRTYRQMIALAVEAVAARRDTRLTIKTHPRAKRDAALEHVLDGAAGLPVTFVRQGPLEPLLAAADCVISCGSSAGIDATLAGLPVIEVIPPGADDFLSRESWGRTGLARNAAELGSLLELALAGPREAPPADAEVFDRGSRPAAARVVDELLPLAAAAPAARRRAA